MNKFELTKESKEFHGRTLYRIRALKDFSNIKKGDLGGWVEKEENLSQKGNCWIYDEAKIFDNACALNSACVLNNVCVLNNACVRDNVYVFDSVCICDSVCISGNGCFSGSLFFSDNGWSYNKLGGLEIKRVFPIIQK